MKFLKRNETSTWNWKSILFFLHNRVEWGLKYLFIWFLFFTHINFPLDSFHYSSSLFKKEKHQYRSINESTRNIRGLSMKMSLYSSNLNLSLQSFNLLLWWYYTYEVDNYTENLLFLLFLSFGDQRGTVEVIHLISPRKWSPSKTVFELSFSCLLLSFPANKFQKRWVQKHMEKCDGEPVFIKMRGCVQNRVWSLPNINILCEFKF